MTDEAPTSASAPSPSPAPEKEPKTDGQHGTAQSPEAANDAAGERPAGTKLISNVLTQAGELTASEHALANANIALQINNLAVGQSRAPRKNNIGTRTLARVRRTFVGPPRLGDAWTVLADQRLLLLCGSPGDGREHLATFLLDAFCDARVREFDNGSLAEVSESDLTVGAGHLWSDPIGYDFGLRSAETLIDRLRRTDSYLVVRWPDDRQCPPELGAFVAEPGRPDLDAVTRQHLPAAADALLEEPSVVAIRRNLSSSREAATLAALLGQVAAGRTPLDVALAKVILPEQSLAEWFGGLPEREDKAFAMALAALDDLSLPSVVAGARHADELLQETEDPKGQSGLRTFHRPTQALLDSVDAERDPNNMRETGYGKVPITSVRFRRRGLARQILDALWEGYPYLQEIYLEWVDDLVRNHDPYVRERAALVAGLLAAHDFEFVRGRLLLDWSADADERLRRAAATALRPPALDDSLREIVWKLLDQWAAYAENSTDVRTHRRLTAATALGGPVGDTNPERALVLIKQRLLPHDPNDYDYELWVATAYAVSELFGDGGTPTSDAVLTHATEWAETKEPGPSNVAVAVLLGLAGKPPDDARADGRRLPPLLRATGRSPENLQRTAVLWRQALGSHIDLATAALNGLRMLADRVGDGDGSDELTAMVDSIPSTNRERRSLTYEIRHWLKDDQHPPLSRRLHDVLSRKE